MPGDLLRVLFIGDVFAKPGRDLLYSHLPGFRKSHEVDVCIVNAENAAGGNGITPKIADALHSYGADIITSGDHTWDRMELEDYLNTHDFIIRPANYPSDSPGKGIAVHTTSDYTSVAVINLLGRVFLRPSDNPFELAERMLKRVPDDCRIVIVDFHAEATSEKIAMSFFLDGRVSAVLGTHTHVPTADERILEEGTAAITDVGMTGVTNSVIGQRPREVLINYRQQVKRRFQPAQGIAVLNGVLLDIDKRTGKARSIQRVQESFRE